MKILTVILALVLLGTASYSVIITRDRDALRSELRDTEATLSLTQAELTSTEQTLTSTQEELSNTEQTLTSVQQDLEEVKAQLEEFEAELEEVEAELALYKNTLGGGQVFSGTQPQIRKPGLPRTLVNLVNKPTAMNPTWSQLRTFLLNDPTDDYIYQKDSFECTNFAEMLHNNAEAAGIRVALVAIHFEGEEVGHALNAFKTTDEGLIYVDCTGRDLLEKYSDVERDKIAYVARGKEYGLISLSPTDTKDFPLSYDDYEDANQGWESYDQKLEAYNEEVKEFNKEVERFKRELDQYEEQTFPSYSWWLKLSAWEEEINAWENRLEVEEDELKELEERLQPIWEPDGIVSIINIYW